MFNLEKSIKNWLKSFRKHSAFNDGAIQEMELHLRDHIDDLISDGQTSKKAFEMAVEEFGEIPELATEEYQNIKTKTNIMSLFHTKLLNNYLKTSTRSLLKNPMSSFINIFGLAAAIGICVFTYGYGQWIFKVDQFHEKKHEVYMVTFFADRDGTLQQNATTPRPLGELLKEDFSNIKRICRVDDSQVIVKYKDKVFHEGLRFADASFLEMLTFPLKWGLSNSLMDPNSIILSEAMSMKYFGEENPIGQQLLVKYGNHRSKSYVISGVAKTFPDACTIRFDFLVNFDNLKLAYADYDKNDWKEFVNATLIEVDNPSDIQVIESGMSKYISIQNASLNEWKIESFVLEQLATLYENSSDMRGGISGKGYNDNLTGVILLSIVAIMLLILACFNYINISIVSAAKRLKEIGLRKVIGASRQNIIFQFLLENILITFFALILGYIFGSAIIIPWFEKLWFFNMDFSINDKYLWIFLTCLLLITGIASGIYPALYISKFQVVGILKGSVKFGKKNPLTKGLLGFQLILSCLLITCAVMFTQNTTYIANRSWGYSQQDAIYSKVSNNASFEILKTELIQNPDVLSIAGSTHHIGKSNSLAIVETPDRSYEVSELSVDANYFQTLGLQLESGRVFKEFFEEDKKSVIINQEFAKNLEYDNPIGKAIKIDSINYQIIGVVMDFHMRSFANEMNPTLFRLTDQDYRFLTMKVRSGSEIEVSKDLKDKWIELFPETPFQGGLQEDVWGGYYNEIDIHGKVWRGIAFIAVLLSSLGLYGLVMLNVSGRIREFSVRKVLGAKSKHIATNIIKHYILLFGIALIIGAPVSYYAVSSLFDLSYPYHIPIGFQGVAISILILVGILLLTVITQVTKLTNSNPVEGLKVE